MPSFVRVMSWSAPYDGSIDSIPRYPQFPYAGVGRAPYSPDPFTYSPPESYDYTLATSPYNYPVTHLADQSSLVATYATGALSKPINRPSNTTSANYTANRHVISGLDQRVMDAATVPSWSPDMPHTVATNPKSKILSLVPVVEDSPINEVHVKEIYHQPKASPPLLRCKWAGCTYDGSFARIHDLRRHVETKHIAPRSYRCPELRCGGKAFNRRENLKEHMRRFHADDDS
ncbi:hypothetical protein BDW74DRAFT_30644 [Aspergillus multicolor]|uniref:uncharacterized protein n=1 Tax=Aspergillus multicolor TaxID=41759 RepID=UPI003CCDC727